MDIKALQKQYKDNPAQKKVKDLEEKMNQEVAKGNRDMGEIGADLSYYSELSYKTSQIQRAIANLGDAIFMTNNEQDVQLKEMAEEEISRLENEIVNLEKEIKAIQIARRFVDKDDDRAVILEIRAGAGGDEAALFAADLFRMYKNYSLAKGWDMQIIDSNITEGGGYKEVIAQIDGMNVFKNLKYESGVHRVQRIPSTESSGRIHTSTASVAILPQAKDVDISIDPADLRIDVMRASGAGGQKVNKTDSAVRITHLPTGIVVSCQETKHQQQNKEKAMALLRSRLYDFEKQKLRDKRSDMRHSQIGSSMRAEKIRTYNFPQNRITDHRVKLSWHNLEEVLNGNIQEMVDNIKDGIQSQLLEEENES